MDTPYTYLAEVETLIDSKDRKDNIIIYASDYKEAMDHVLDYYSDEDITIVKLTYVSDMPFALTPDQVANVVANQEKINWGD